MLQRMKPFATDEIGLCPVITFGVEHAKFQWLFTELISGFGHLYSELRKP